MGGGVSACHRANEVDCKNADGGFVQEDCVALNEPVEYNPAQVFGLAAATGRGEVSLFTVGPTSLGAGLVDQNGQPIVDVNHRQVRTLDSAGGAIIDLDPSTPGFGFVPVGGSPERLRTSNDGCKAVTANVGTCDLAVMDVLTMIKKASDPSQRGTFPDDVVTRVRISAGGKPLAARPTWIEMTPSTTSQDTTGTCSATTPYHAFVAFAGCNLVADVDLSNGNIVQALHLNPGGGATIVTDLSTLTCPVECTGEPLDGGTAPPLVDGGGGVDASSGAVDASSGAVDASSGGDGGMGPPMAPQPHSLAIHPDITTHTCTTPQPDCVSGQPCNCLLLYVADAVHDALTVVELSPTLGSFGTSRALPLEAPGGVDTIRISHRVRPPLVTNGNVDLVSNATDDPGMRYLFAIGNDRTVHVVDADANSECETNADPGTINQHVPIVEGGALKNSPYDVQKALRCIPIGGVITINDIMFTAPRQPLAIGPGIALPGGALPRDIQTVRIDRPLPVLEGTLEAAPGLPIGDFAWIVDSSGHITAVNLFDRCVQPNIPTSLGVTNPQQACDVQAFLPSVQRPLARQAGRRRSRSRRTCCRLVSVPETRASSSRRPTPTSWAVRASPRCRSSPRR